MHQAPIENNYRTKLRVYEPKCIFPVSNYYYETLREVEGSFVVWPYLV